MLNVVGDKKLDVEYWPAPKDFACKGCGGVITLKLSEYRSRKTNKFGLFCTKDCANKYRVAQAANKPTHVTITCTTCSGPGEVTVGYYKERMRRNSPTFFCSKECSIPYHKAKRTFHPKS